MKNVWIVMLVCVCFIGCDDMSKPAMDVVGDILTPAEEPTIEGALPIETTEAEIPELTFENAYGLEAGRYRIRPTGYQVRFERGENVLSDIYWGNVSSKGELIERFDFPPDAPKISVTIWLDSRPYELTPDAKRVIGFNFEQNIYDEIVIELSRRFSESDSVGGVRGNTFEYKQFNYTGILIENLTNPNRKFQYNGASVEETPTTEPEIPEITFENVLDVVEGKRYRLRPTTISTDINREHLFITTAYWGNVDIDEKFIENGTFPADARKVRLFLAFDPPIHTYTPEDEIVIGVLPPEI